MSGEEVSSSERREKEKEKENELIQKIEEEKKRSLIQKINSLENEEDKDIAKEISSFESLPILFCGLNVSQFGLSSSLHQNPFFKLSDIAKDKTKSWEDRTQAIRYMQRIPHIHRDKHCIEGAISILDDTRYPIEQRYHFFSNNERFIKLDYEIVNACHHHYFFKSSCKTLLYKILSAQYLLTQFPLGTYDVDSVQSFLIDIAKDKNSEINYRAECADILDRAGYGEAKTIGTETIIELGELYLQNKKNTIYTNLQNVHDTTVNKSVVETLRRLIETTPPPDETTNSEQVYTSITDMKYYDENTKKREAVIETFQRILIDTSRYEGLSMCDIMMLVWEKIKTNEELVKRLIDEMYEMHQTCSTGHLSRLLNVLSGFFEEFQPVKISYRDQLRSNVFARYTAALRSVTQYERDEITSQITSDYKGDIENFIFSYSPREELEEEFVGGGFMGGEEFEEVFKRSERDFFGLKD